MNILHAPVTDMQMGAIDKDVRTPPHDTGAYGINNQTAGDSRGDTFFRRRKLGLVNCFQLVCAF